MVVMVMNSVLFAAALTGTPSSKAIVHGLFLRRRQLNGRHRIGGVHHREHGRRIGGVHHREHGRAHVKVHLLVDFVLLLLLRIAVQHGGIASPSFVALRLRVWQLLLLLIPFPATLVPAALNAPAARQRRRQHSFVRFQSAVVVVVLLLVAVSTRAASLAVAVRKRRRQDLVRFPQMLAVVAVLIFG